MRERERERKGEREAAATSSNSQSSKASGHTAVRLDDVRTEPADATDRGAHLDRKGLRPMNSFRAARPPLKIMQNSVSPQFNDLQHLFLTRVFIKLYLLIFRKDTSLY